MWNFHKSFSVHDTVRHQYKRRKTRHWFPSRPFIPEPSSTLLAAVIYKVMPVKR